MGDRTRQLFTLTTLALSNTCPEQFPFRRHLSGTYQSSFNWFCQSYFWKVSEQCLQCSTELEDNLQELLRLAICLLLQEKMLAHASLYRCGLAAIRVMWMNV